jgi:hypothetical protein
VEDFTDGREGTYVHWRGARHRPVGSQGESPWGNFHSKYVRVSVREIEGGGSVCLASGEFASGEFGRVGTHLFLLVSADMKSPFPPF